MVEVTIHDKNLRDALIDHWEDLPEEAIDELLATHRIEAAKAERDRLRELPDDALARVNVFRDEIDDSDLRAIATALADALESQP